MKKSVYLVKDLDTGKYFKHYWKWVSFNENPVIFNSISSARATITTNSCEYKNLTIISCVLTEMFNVGNNLWLNM